MTNLTVTIKVRCDDELRDYIVDSIVMGIPCGSAERTDVVVDFDKESNND